ncbi:MAG: DUF1176 domain-containing protein [Parvularculaceae bacterium]|nr:DUF1176 domain-containing protein [Parvularculaceae bacterium]
MLLLAPLFAAALAGALPEADTRSFKFWIVGCDNGLLCHAAAMAPINGDESNTMSFMRGPEADDVPVVRFVSADKPVAAIAGGVRFALTEYGDYPAVAPADMPAFIDAIRKAEVIFLVGENNAQLGVVSLAGASASMLYMDEQQRRLGTQSALIRKGPRTYVPPPPPLPVIKAPALSRAEPVAIDRSALFADVGLSDEEAREFNMATYRLDANTTLALIETDYGGAYNIEYIVMLADNKGAWRPAPFDTAADMSGEGPAADGLYYGATNAAYESQNGLLIGGPLCRGVGDCGHQFAYVWDGAVFRKVRGEALGASRGRIVPISTLRASVIRARR